jgi:hypothetical protein
MLHDPFPRHFTPDRDHGAAPNARDDGPVFRELWEAHAFAMALSLHERGLFTWKE